MKIRFTLLTLMVVINTIYLNAPIRIIETEEKIDLYNKIQKENKYFELYDEALNTLKEFEGLRLTAYGDANGKSIGYGHYIKSYEKIPVIITKEYAEALLRIDFEHAIQVVEKTTNMNRFESPEKVLALSHFVYNLGSGNFESSTMLKNIKRNLPIDKEIVRWTKIKTADAVIDSSHLRMRRIYELTLYNNG